jgi:lysophospholipase L1-like esterase
MKSIRPMRFVRSHKLGAGAVGFACVGVLVAALAGPVTASFAATQRHAPARHAPARHSPGWRKAGRDYLALGDSVTFGYREPTTTPAPNYLDASSFVGYPEDLGAALGLRVANAACPGETSLSFVEADVQSNGCENSPGGGPGYRTAYPLHVSYSGTQLQYALHYLWSHPHTRLVSLMIGANDAFLCEETTTDDCATELPGVLKQISANVTDILSAIRQQAHYHGQIVIVNYYSLDYASATDNEGSQALNVAMDTAAAPFHVQIADGYATFENAALQSGGNSCTAGLLTQLSTGGCGVHPSVAGQALLALAVEEAIRH